MMPRNSLTQLAKLIAKDLSAAQASDGLRDVGEAMAAAPEAVLEVLDLMISESRRKKPNQSLLGAFAFMVGQALEVWRFSVERRRPEAIEAVASVQARLRELAQAGRLDSGTLLLILRQFVSAKLNLDDDLRELMAHPVEQEPVEDLIGEADLGRMLANMVGEFGGDIFALQAELAEQASAFPESHRTGIAAAVLGAPDPSLQDAALGWLLDLGASTRRDTVALLGQVALAGRVSGTMLRRMITIRNWLPDGEHAALDAVIRACRQKGIACAPLKPPEVDDVVTTAIDGSGAQSLFVMVKDGRKRAAAALLVKSGIGVRDAWVRGGLTKAQAETFLSHVNSQTECYKSSLDHTRLMLAHALAVAKESGALPPFGLVDVVERAGLADINPEAVPVDKLVARLLADIPANRRPASMVARALRSSADWPGEFSFLESWFEDDADIDTLLEGKHLSARAQTALVLDKYLVTRRAHWADLLAWTAVALRQDEMTGKDWVAFALTAHELLEGRPLSEIPVMAVIAQQTIEAWKSRLF